MYLPECSLPLMFDPFPGESGLGYCLRVLSRNGTDFHGLRRLLGIGEATPFNRSHALEMAKLFQVSIPWLQEALPESHRVRTGARSIFGHQLFVHNHLRLHSPQVCAQCIHRYGFCRATWELSMGTVCIEHGSTLIVQCHECGQALRWDRPSVDIGHCGHYIKVVPDQPTISENLLKWQKFVDCKFTLDGSVMDVNPPNWQKVLQPMTLGGIFTVVVAFGCIERPLTPINAGFSVKNLNPSEWQAIVQRAIPRLTALESGCDGDELSSLVAQPLLLRLLKVQIAAVDQQTALSLLVKVFNTQVDRQLLGKYPHLGQQTLF